MPLQEARRVSAKNCAAAVIKLNFNVCARNSYSVREREREWCVIVQHRGVAGARASRRLRLSNFGREILRRSIYGKNTTWQEICWFSFPGSVGGGVKN